MRSLPCIALLLHDRNARVLLPKADTRLQAGDRLLLCGNGAGFTRLAWTLFHPSTLRWVQTGEDQGIGWLWRNLRLHRR